MTSSRSVPWPCRTSSLRHPRLMLRLACITYQNPRTYQTYHLNRVGLGSSFLCLVLPQQVVLLSSQDQGFSRGTLQLPSHILDHRQNLPSLLHLRVLLILVACHPCRR